MITWLKGMTRIKGEKYTREVAGFRCSGCNYFALRQMRKCPSCGGEYKGKIQGEKQ